MAVIAASGFFLITQLQVVFSKIAEIPPKYLQQFEEMLESLKSMGPVGFFFIIAFLPAVCEELLFRGYILDGLTRKLGAASGIILTGVLFGAFHLDPYRLIPASLLGIIFGLAVWKGGSIFYGMTGHLVNNGLAFLAVLIGEEKLGRYISETDFAPLWAIILASIVFAGAFYLFWRIPISEKRKDDS